MRKFTQEEWIGIACIIIFALFLLYVMTGCTTGKKASGIHVVWSDGKCILIADGMTIEQAKDLSQTWEFKSCDVKVTE